VLWRLCYQMGKRPRELLGELPPGSDEPWSEGELAFMKGGFMGWDEEQMMIMKAQAGARVF